jgi:hypothetical protein
MLAGISAAIKVQDLGFPTALAHYQWSGLARCSYPSKLKVLRHNGRISDFNTVHRYQYLSRITPAIGIGIDGDVGIAARD